MKQANERMTAQIARQLERGDQQREPADGAGGPGGEQKDSARENQAPLEPMQVYPRMEEDAVIPQIPEPVALHEMPKEIEVDIMDEEKIGCDHVPRTVLDAVQ